MSTHDHETDDALVNGGDDGTGIPYDLIPYLEEADTAEGAPEGDASDGGEATADDGDDERAAALRALMENAMLLGPDPSILDELTDDEDEESDADGRARAEAIAHAAALDAAQEDAAIAAEVHRIYTDIVSRAPEHKVQPSLERVRAVLDILGDPQSAYPAVHLTGTNGKTSTARMIDSLLSAMGLTIGRFTSPHLIDVRERISIGGEPITPEAFIDAWNDVAPYIDMVDQKSAAEGGPRLSFFEVFTVMAYAAFAEHAVDAAVVEVGMGGTWDATNVIDAGVAVITPIDLDHQKWLGSSIEDIAREKAGIIKRHQTVVISEQPEAAMRILLERAHEVDAIARVEGVDWEVLAREPGVGGQMVTIRTPLGIYEDVIVPLLGEYQAHHAAQALVAVEAFLGGRQLDPTIVENGFAAATSPGRLQVVRSSPTVLVDAAHNPAGVRSLREAIDESFDFEHVVGLFSAMGDKSVEEMLGEMEPVLDELVLTQLPGERAMDREDLEAIAVDVFGPDRVHWEDELADALTTGVDLAEQAGGPATSAGVVVFGSIVLAGEVEALMNLSR